MISQNELGVGSEHQARAYHAVLALPPCGVAAGPIVKGGAVHKQVAHRRQAFGAVKAAQTAPENGVIDLMDRQQFERAFNQGLVIVLRGFIEETELGAHALLQCRRKD